MGRQGGQGKGKPKLKDRDFGKALVRKMKQTRQKGYDENTRLISILENTSLEDYIASAEMDGNGVEVVHVHDNDAYLIEPTQRIFQKMSEGQFDYEHVKIPRRPKWNSTMTADDLDRNEKNAFLQWRRDIALMEASNESKKVTPYEKNLDVWRQLWRVVEKSDFGIQIVDARNPLLYYTEDLVRYSTEVNKKKPKLVMLLVNKADFLTDNQRRLWSRYFHKKGIAFAFYSARIANDKLEKKNRAENGLLDEDDESYDEEDETVDEDMIDLLSSDIVSTWKFNMLKRFRSERKLAKLALKEAKKARKNMNDDSLHNAEDYNDNEEAEEEEEEVEGVLDDENDDENRDREDDIEDESENDADNQDQLFEEDDEEEDEDDEEEEEFDNRHNLWSNEDNNPHLQQELERLGSKILSRTELLELMKVVGQKLDIVPQQRHTGHVCVGMLGYPNVGKSSVINTLLQACKSTHGVVRVAVSSTPGKTKHFQTLMVDDDLMLCDCPGLVFPSFMGNTGEMLCSGILPINQMRDCVEPAAVIASRIPIPLLDATYGMHIKRILDVKDNPKRPPTGSEMLAAYCLVKGYIAGGTGRWDEFRGCKDILRDFNDGRLLYCCPPPGMAIDGARWMADIENIMCRSERVAERLALQRLQELETLTEEANEDALGLSNNSGRNELQHEMLAGYEEGEFVFGDGDGDVTLNNSSSTAGAKDGGNQEIEYQYYDDEDEDGQLDELNSAISSSTTYPSAVDPTKPKRDHKRLKHWGKKNKKLRDKDPYSESNGAVSYVAYSTNRNKVGGEKLATVKLQGSRLTHGSVFVRPNHPHYQQNKNDNEAA